MIDHTRLSGRRRGGRGHERLERLQARALALSLARHFEAASSEPRLHGPRPASALSAGLPPELSPFPRPAIRRAGALAALRAIGLGLLLAHVMYMAAVAILAAVYARVDPPVTVLMAYRKWGYGWKLERPRPLALRRVPPQVRAMLVAVEDRKFYSHSGFDLDAFARAREVNKKLGMPLYGGSTLTMQLARTLFLVPEKSYLRKYLEAIATVELELLLRKDRILELYFGYAEWGPGVFGIEAAARHWYGRGLAALTRDQSAKLIALLSSPIKYTPETLKRSKILRERYDYLAARFMTVKPPDAQAPASEAQTPASTTQADASTARAASDEGTASQEPSAEETPTAPSATAQPATAVALASALVRAKTPAAASAAVEVPRTGADEALPSPAPPAAEEEEAGIEGPPLDPGYLTGGPGEASESSGPGASD